MFNLSEINKNHKEAVQKYIDKPKEWVAVNLHYLAIMDVVVDQQRSTHIGITNDNTSKVSQERL